VEILTGSCLYKPRAPLILQPSKFTARNSMTSASTAILVLFDGAIFSTIMIAFTFEITRMAAGAERRVS